MPTKNTVRVDLHFYVASQRRHADTHVRIRSRCLGDRAQLLRRRNDGRFSDGRVTDNSAQKLCVLNSSSSRPSKRPKRRKLEAARGKWEVNEVGGVPPTTSARLSGQRSTLGTYPRDRADHVASLAWNQEPPIDPGETLHVSGV